MSNNNKELETLGILGGVLVAGSIAGAKLIHSAKETTKKVVNHATAGTIETAVKYPAGYLETGFYLTLVAAGLGLISYEVLRRHYEKKAKEQIEYFQIIPHAENDISEQRINNLVTSLHQMRRPIKERITKGREWFQLYFACVDDKSRGELGRIEIYIGFPRDRLTFAKGKIQAAFPGCGLKQIHHSKVPYFPGKGTGGYMKFKDRDMKGFPLQKFKSNEDKMTGVLSFLRPGTSLAVTFSPVSLGKLKAVIKKSKKKFFKKIKFDPKTMKRQSLETDEMSILTRLEERQQSRRAFNVKVAVWQEERETADNIYSVVNELNARLSIENGLYLKKTLSNPINLTPSSIYMPLFISEFLELIDRIPYFKLPVSMIWTAQELANLVQLPRGMSAQQRARKENHIFNRIDHITPGQSDIPENEFVKGVLIGNSLNPAQDFRPIYLLEDVFRKMALIIGKTGSGKTAIAYMMAQFLIRQRLGQKNGGFTIIDPKQSFAYNVLTFLNKLKVEGILTEEAESLFHFYDVTSKDYCFSINPMQKPKRNLSEDEKNEMTTNTLEVMKAAYPGDSILFERYASLAIKCLLEDPKQDHTILAIADFLDKESPLRSRLYGYLKKGDTYQQRLALNIERMGNGFGGSDCAPVLNRLHRLQENPRTRRIFGQKKTSIDPLKYMEQGHIVLFNVEGLSQDEMRLVMGYIMMEYHRSANKRRNRAENHYLMVDESHEVQLPVMWEKIIPKDREFGLCLLLMTQYLEQFNKKLLDAITEIGGTFISCISGAESAQIMQKITTGRVQATDIQNYRALTASIDTEDSEGDRVTFMVKSDPPYVFDSQGEQTYYGEDKQRRDDEKNAAYINAFEQIGHKWIERDCRLNSEVDAEINAYLETLWGKTTVKLEAAKTEAAVSLEDSKVVSFPSKKEDQKEKAVGNVFGWLDNEEGDK